MKKIIASIYMQVGVTIIGLPNLLDFSRYAFKEPKIWAPNKSKFHS